MARLAASILWMAARVLDGALFEPCAFDPARAHVLVECPHMDSGLVGQSAGAPTTT
mgnify:CR=1 FL=1